jgi:hypothetical protein
MFLVLTLSPAAVEDTRDPGPKLSEWAPESTHEDPSSGGGKKNGKKGGGKKSGNGDDAALSIDVDGM